MCSGDILGFSSSGRTLLTLTQDFTMNRTRRMAPRLGNKGCVYGKLPGLSKWIPAHMDVSSPPAESSPRVSAVDVCARLADYAGKAPSSPCAGPRTPHVSAPSNISLPLASGKNQHGPIQSTPPSSHLRTGVRAACLAYGTSAVASLDLLSSRSLYDTRWHRDGFTSAQQFA